MLLWCSRLNRLKRNGGGITVDRGGDRLVPRFIAGFNKLRKRVGNLVIEAGFGHIGVFVRHIARRRDGLDSGRLVELLNLGEKIGGLTEVNRVAIAIEESLEEGLLRSDQAGDP